ncbi:MAG: hypothetical protein ACRENS_10655, partial [Candidatus Eiseniibacteriota bacterium]
PLALLALLLALAGAPPARAQGDSGSPLPAPWVPAGTDTIRARALRARAEFQLNVVDTIDDVTFHPYEKVALIAHDMLVSLGRDHMSQCAALEGALHDMGFKVTLRLDPAQSGFALLMVRNPYRVSAAAIGYLFWWQGDRLRQQGTYFRRGFDPRFRVWWTGRSEWPYLCAIVDHGAAEDERPGFLVLHLAADASHWLVVQYPGSGPDLEVGEEPAWEDIDGDGRPELLTWLRVPSDTLFTECAGCAGLIRERVFTIHDDRFEPEDARLVPTTYAQFQRFVRLLTDGRRASARELVARQGVVDSALAFGWGTDQRAGAWHLDTSESGQLWPRWIVVRQTRARGRPLYAVHFEHPKDRWLISGIIPERNFGPDSSAAKYGGAGPKGHP